MPLNSSHAVIYEGHSNENRSPTRRHIPRKSWQHCCYVSKTHTSTQLFLYCSGGERSVKCVRPALEMEASKEVQRGVVRLLVAEGAGTQFCELWLPCLILLPEQIFFKANFKFYIMASLLY